ncbi:MAG: lysine 2,3-aminomutase [Deltaproteobacteria bacterium HGW-Deltaproteobacteria-13]|jgi:lysine 2,3-aminomutase|nr:MAG: lysine 2,3-aminomutase [Deltaproteobacteria bacterium HGW-Deltaproteobacteria-13]
MNKKLLLSHLNNAAAKDWRDWRWQFKNRVTRIETLETLLGKTALPNDGLKAVTSVYPLAITPYYLSLMQGNDIHDPIRAQCVPDPREISGDGNIPEDPLEEDSHMPVPKLVHRYADRCLAIMTETCATYCRHCNRKRFWSHSNHLSLKTRMHNMLRYIAEMPQIREVIISGGDPLILDDHILEYLLSSLKAIPHIDVLRIGSRVPVVMPMRITGELCRMLKRYRPLWFNTQFNHPSEITSESARACNMLQEAGIPVSNQSVLLQGINDSPEVMRNLLYGLQKISVRPYYLFHCDPAKGCLHFRTEPKASIALMEKIWQQCSGLCLPQYVLDVPGSAGKLPLNMLSGKIKNDLKNHQHFFDKFK